MGIPQKLKELAKKYKVKLTYKRKGKRYNKTEKMLSNIIASKVCLLYTSPSPRD